MGKQRIYEFNIDDVEKLIKTDVLKLIPNISKRNRILIGVGSIALDNLRYQVMFTHEIKCCSCGREADYFGMNKDTGENGGYELNLYYKQLDGKEYMLSKNIIDKEGKKNDCYNYNLICSACIEKKQKEKREIEKKEYLVWRETSKNPSNEEFRKWKEENN